MSFNPFDERPEKLDKVFMDWKEMYPVSYDKNDVSPYTKLRCILMNGTEFEAVWFSHQFHRHCNNNDLRRELATVRKSEQQQQKRIACIKPINENVLETTISYEQLAVDLTATLAQREANPYVKMALDFALLEDFDHLYRYANLLNLEQGIPAEKLVGRYTEIMPARPTISEHRYPWDDVKRYTDYKTAAPLTKLNIGIIVAAEQQTMNYYMNQAGFYTSDLGRQLYSEIGMIEEQHVTHYGSLMDVNETWLECLLNHEYAECYLYYSCYCDESDEKIKKIWERHFNIELAHLHKAAELLKRFEGKEWSEVIPVGAFPELLSLGSQIDYIRGVLQSSVGLTAKLEDYVEADKMTKESNFYKYQNMVNVDTKAVPSHRIIDRHIKDVKQDYRFEVSKNPIASLQSRTNDNISLGRV